MSSNTSKTLPAIVIIAYNRHDSLRRLLYSLSAAKYPANDIQLIISIDKSHNYKVFEVATAFLWQHGNKEIIAHTENLGLKKHVISCGDLTERFGAVIILEDDLFVSPEFYLYATECLLFYSEDNKIAGISLYTHRTNVICNRPFEPIYDGTDVFFFQFASSWGQAWTEKQWRGFKSWYESSQRTVSYKDFLPNNVISWPESSWLKYFIKYMVENDLYFVYPRNSLTTNFSDPGTHNYSSSSLFQVPLQVNNFFKKWRLIDFHASLSVYDVFFELVPSTIIHFLPDLKSRNFSVDLYGTKPLNKIQTPQILTCRPCKKGVAISFGCSLKPRVANILCRMPGKIFNLSSIADVQEMSMRPRWEIDYDINLLEDKNFYLHVLRKLFNKLKMRIFKLLK